MESVDSLDITFSAADMNLLNQNLLLENSKCLSFFEILEKVEFLVHKLC